jgi:hypothetical protein
MIPNVNSNSPCETTIIAEIQEIAAGLLEKGKVVLEVFFKLQGIKPSEYFLDSAAFM